jgi:hypothetical protein
LQILKKAREVALNNSLEAGNTYKEAHDKKASQHNLKDGDYAYLDNQLFLGKNKKLAQRLIGLYLVKKVINDQNVELQISPKRDQIHSAYRLKKFIDPKTSKFLNEEKRKKERAESQATELNPGKLSQNQGSNLNEEIKSRIEQRITRSMANRNKEKQAGQAIAVINNFIIPDSKKYKLKTIAKKIYQSIKLCKEEASFWNSFPNSEKSYILTRHSAQTLEFTKYQKSGYCSEHLPAEYFEQEDQNWQEPNLFFELSSSDSDSSEDPNYIQPVPLKKTITTSDDSWPDNSNSSLYNRPSTSKQQQAEQDNPGLESNSSTESSETDTTPSTPTRGRPKAKNMVDSWKNTATTLWKPTTKVIENPDLEAISTRTRSKQIQDVSNQMASHPHDLNIDTVCCYQNKQERAQSPSSV